MITDKEFEELARDYGQHKLNCTCGGKVFNEERYKSFKAGFQKCQELNNGEIEELKKVNKDLIEKNVSILVMDYISQGLDLHYQSKLEELKAKVERYEEALKNLKDNLPMSCTIDRETVINALNSGKDQ